MTSEPGLPADATANAAASVLTYVWCPFCGTEIPAGTELLSGDGPQAQLRCPSCGALSGWADVQAASAAWLEASDRRVAADHAARRAAEVAAAAQAMAQTRDEAEGAWRSAFERFGQLALQATSRGSAPLTPPGAVAAAPVPAATPAFGVAAMLQTIGALLLVAALVTASAVLWGRMQPWQQLALLWAMVAVVGVVAGLLAHRMRVTPRVLAGLTVAAGFVVAVAAAQLSETLSGPWYPTLVTSVCAIILVGVGRMSGLRLWSVAGAVLLPIAAALAATWAMSEVFRATGADGLGAVRATVAGVSLALAGTSVLLSLAAGRPTLLGGRTAVLWVSALSLCGAGATALLAGAATVPGLVEGPYFERVWAAVALVGVGLALVALSRLSGWRGLRSWSGVPLGLSAALWCAGPPATQLVLACVQPVLAAGAVGLLLALQWRWWQQSSVRWLTGAGAAAFSTAVIAAQLLLGVIAEAARIDAGASERHLADSFAALTVIVTCALVGSLVWVRGTVVPWRPGSSAPGAPIRPLWLSWTGLVVVIGAWAGAVVQGAQAGIATDAAPEALSLGMAALVLVNLWRAGPRPAPVVTQLIVAAALVPSAWIWILAPLVPPDSGGLWGGDPWWRQAVVLVGVALLFTLAARAKGPYTVPVGVAAGLAVGHIWVWAGTRSAPPVESFTLPLAVALGAVLVAALHPRGPLLRSARPDEAPADTRQPPHWFSALWLGLPLLIALLPSAFGAEASGDGAPRFWIVVLVSAGLTVAGAVLRVAGLFVPAALALAIATLPVILAYTAAISTWIPLTVGGLLLIGVGVRFEQARYETRRLLHWLRDLR
ncbi:MAG: hypothetical protein RLZ55_233 [Actinomycetota bacterium]